MSEITVVGCGAMGSRLINAFMNAGHDVVIVELNKANAEPFIARGARYSASLQDAPETDTILLNVPNNNIAKAILEGCTKERLEGKQCINTTTSGTMEDVLAIEKVAKSFGLHYLDARIEAYPETVGPEKGYMVYAGDQEVFENNKEMLLALGKATYIGNNAGWAWLGDMAVIGVHGGAMFALFEMAAMAMKQGCPLDKICQVVGDTLPTLLEVNYDQIINELKDYDGTFEDYNSTDVIIEERGSHYVYNAVVSSGVKPIIHDHMLEIYNKLIEGGLGRKSMAAVANYLMDKM